MRRKTDPLRRRTVPGCRRELTRRCACPVRDGSRCVRRSSVIRRAPNADPRIVIARRRFGLWYATALVVGNIIGSAIFMLPASLAPYGWNAVSAWLGTVVGALCLAWVFAQLSRY